MSNSLLNSQPLSRKTVIICEVIVSLALCAFSFSVVLTMRHLQSDFAEELPIPPISRFIFKQWFLIHCPLIALAGGTAFDFVSVKRSQKTQIVWMCSCYIVFALLAASWLIGCTLPFWKIQ
jgi:hypothetical protein